MKRVLALALMLLLGACTQPVAPEQAASIKTIGIIAVHSDTINLQTAGILVFSNDFKSVPVPEWHLGQYLTDRLGAALAAKYQVRPVTFDRDAFLPGHVRYPNTTSLFISVPTIAQAIHDHATPSDLDAYLVVTEAGSNLGSSNQALVGDGILHIQALLTPRYIVHALYRIVVVNRTGDVIGDTVASSSAFNPFTDVIRGPNFEVNSSWWADSYEQMTTAQKQQLEGGIKQLVDKSVPFTLGTLKLLP